MRRDRGGGDEEREFKLSSSAALAGVWLADLTNPYLVRGAREASAEALAERTGIAIPRLLEMSRSIRAELPERASLKTWLSAAGWLIGSIEQIPRNENPSARVSPERVRALLGPVTGG